MKQNDTRAGYALKIRGIIEANPQMPLRELNRLLSDMNPGDTLYQQNQWRLETVAQLRDRPAIQ